MDIDIDIQEVAALLSDILKWKLEKICWIQSAEFSTSPTMYVEFYAEIPYGLWKDVFSKAGFFPTNIECSKYDDKLSFYKIKLVFDHESMPKLRHFYQETMGTRFDNDVNNFLAAPPDKV